MSYYKKLFKVVSMRLFLLFLIFNLLGCINENKDSNNVQLDKLKEEALQDWEDVYENRTYHGSALRKMKRIIKNSSSNQKELVEISEMISELSFHTDVLLSIAKAASRAKNDNIDFIKIAELGVIKFSESKLVIDLANYAATIKKDDSLDLFNKKYEELRATADADSIDHAIELVDEMIKKAKANAKKI